MKFIQHFYVIQIRPLNQPDPFLEKDLSSCNFHGAHRFTHKDEAERVLKVFLANRFCENPRIRKVKVTTETED